MRWFVALLLALGSHGVLAGPPPIPSGGPSLPQPVLVFDFANGRYRLTTAVPTSTPPITITRTGAAEWQADSAGVLHSFNSNVAAITNLGIGAAGGSTNFALHSRDLTNASWVVSNSTDITRAQTATGADGAANSATKLTGAASNGTILQSVTATSSAECFSAYVQRVTGTGEIDMTLDNGSTWTNVTSALTTTGYTRVPQVAAGCVQATATNPVVGFRIVTSGDAINVDFTQLEKLTVATPPIVTTTTSVARGQDTISAAVSPSVSGEYVILANYISPQLPGSAIVTLSDGTANNIGEIFLNASNLPRFQMTTGGNAAKNFAPTIPAITFGLDVKSSGGVASVSRQAQASKSYVNLGAAVTAGGTALSPPTGLNKLSVGSSATGTAPCGCIISKIAVYPVGVSLSKLQNIVGNGNGGVP